MVKYGSHFFANMLRTKVLVSSINEIPREWVFEYYLSLPERLTGQDLKVRSIFNPSGDKNPSLSIYFSKRKGVYMFNDFSTDNSGDGVELVRSKFSLKSRGEAAHKIIEDYNQYTLTHDEDYSLREFKIRQKYRVSSFETRSWNTSDQKYWSRYYIGSRLLNKYNVIPLAGYEMKKEIPEKGPGEFILLPIKGPRIYGYFKQDGSLYKIYQPMLKENKFIRVRDYIQGTEQLTTKVPFLVITSSLKDLMAFQRLGITNAESIAPDSENVLIPTTIMTQLLNSYKATCTLFDVDAPGLKAMQKYQDVYNIPGAKLMLEKDLSDSIEKYGIDHVRKIIIPLLRKELSL